VKAHSSLAFAAVFLAFSVPAFAQVPGADQTAPAPAQTETAPNLRAQTRTMETVLLSAVQNGVDRLAQKINEVAPGVRLFAGQPHAHGYQVDSVGWFFDVEVPEIYPGVADLYLDLLPTGVRGQAPPPNGGMNVGNSVPKSDPMQAAVVRDPNGEYRLAIREALIDAMIDFGQMPLKPSEMLTVGARGPDPMGGPNVSSSGVLLVLSITGDDLMQFRQGKITRTDVKTRIKIKEAAR